MDTIYALSSGNLPSAIAVIRVSGDQVTSIIKQLVSEVPVARQLKLYSFKDRSGEILDHGMLVYFANPHSFTGEDSAEFHLHGGKAVVARFLEELSSFPQCRMAEPGEFARRAFMNNKFDLTEAEGLADLIEAETESQRRLALMGAGGALADIYRHWREMIIQARAMLEAELDFADESDVPGSVSDQSWSHVKDLIANIEHHLEAGKLAKTMRDGIKIVIAGFPNSGKSSIINRLAKRHVAIVTDEAGTTRDALEVRIAINGLPVLITDTAGIRESDNIVEQQGIEIAKSRIQEADLVLLVEDRHAPQKIELPDFIGDVWTIGNKSDLIVDDNQQVTNYDFNISAKNGDGFEQFMDALSHYCQEKQSRIGEIIPTRQRQIDLLQKSKMELLTALTQHHLPLELRAEHLRIAGDYLGRLTGDIDVEDLLDIIFSQFCIGK